MASGRAPISGRLSLKEQRYDRQLRLWGDHGQEALESAHVCVINATATGTEILKNLVLPGIGSFTIVDGNQVTGEDVGNSFFLQRSNIGQNRSQCATALLQELNNDVSGNVVEENPDKLLDNDPFFFSRFNVVIATQLPESTLLKLADVLWNYNIPLLVCRTYGLIGYMRMVVKEHPVVESHPDNALDDLRLDNPFPELREHIQSYDLEHMGKKEHRHIPWIVIVSQYLEKWYNENNGQIPKNYKEKEAFREMIRQGILKNENGVLEDEENFEEAIKNVNTAVIPTKVPSSIEEIFNDNSCISLSQQTPPFWILARAVKEFVAKEGQGNLPVRGTIPDMIADSSKYIKLQNIYRDKAKKDADAVANYTAELLQSVGKAPESISQKELKLLCSNSAFLQVIRCRSLSEEYGVNTSNKDEITSHMDNPDSEMVLYLMLRAVDRFFKHNGRYPGVYNYQMEDDIGKLKSCLNSFLQEYGLSVTVKDDYVHEFCRYGAAEPHTIAAFLGGAAAQEVVKIITRQFEELRKIKMENGKDWKIKCEIKTDLNLLLECLKYQMDHPASQKEALVTIYSVCHQNSIACGYFREIGGLTFVYNLAKSRVHSMVKEAALFTLGGLAENNVFCQQMLCTSELFEDLRMFLTNKDSSINLKRMTIYVLLVLVSNNNNGQTYVRETGCLDILLQLFRMIPSALDIKLLDHSIDQYHLWSSVCSGLCVCVNNPQNEENQKACGLVFPHAKDWLQSCLKSEIVRPICSFIGLTVANNSRMQNFFISIGGLAVLDELLVKLINSSFGNNRNVKLAVVVTKTLDACIADNPAVGINLPRYNIVHNLLKLLSYNSLDSGEQFSIILTLGHCTEICEENQYTLVKNNGLPLMIQVLTESQDEELNKAVTFVLQNCKQITEKLSVKTSAHSFRADETGKLEIDLQDRERIPEDYWNEATEILHRIKSLETAHKEEDIRRQISIDDVPQGKFLHTMTKHLQMNSSKKHSNHGKIYTEVISSGQNTSNSKFENCSSNKQQFKSANKNPTDASVNQNDHKNLLHTTEKMTTSNLNKACITNKNTIHDFRKGHAKTSEFCFKQPEFVVKSPVKKKQNRDIFFKEIQYSNRTKRGMNHVLTGLKVTQLRCSGCRTVGLSLNSRNFSKILQSCQYLCEQHKVILQTEMQYKRKLKQSIISNRKTSMYNNANLQQDANSESKAQSMKQSYSLQDQDLDEDNSFEDERIDIHLSNMPATTFKKNKRRIRKDFTSDEIKYLLEGVKKMGHHWNSILWGYPFQKGRTNVDLAKKYCKLQKSEKNKTTQRQRN